MHHDAPPGAEPFSAVVLAGGFSKRMGRDKALLAPEGAPLWERQREILFAAGAAEIFLSARDDQRWANVAAESFSGIVRDIESDAGPLAGIVAAFERAAHSRLAVLAIDLPHMTAAYLGGLAGRRGAPGVVPAWPDGKTEPLCAIYPLAALEFAVRALERRQLAVREWVAALERARLIARVAIAPEDTALFLNWNEPHDLPPGIR